MEDMMARGGSEVRTLGLGDYELDVSQIRNEIVFSQKLDLDYPPAQPAAMEFAVKPAIANSRKSSKKTVQSIQSAVLYCCNSSYERQKMDL
jgi:hypothetical protein